MYVRSSWCGELYTSEHTTSLDELLMAYLLPIMHHKIRHTYSIRAQPHTKTGNSYVSIITRRPRPTHLAVLPVLGHCALTIVLHTTWTGSSKYCRMRLLVLECRNCLECSRRRPPIQPTETKPCVWLPSLSAMNQFAVSMYTQAMNPLFWISGWTQSVYFWRHWTPMNSLLQCSLSCEDVCKV